MPEINIQTSGLDAAIIQLGQLQYYQSSKFHRPVSSVPNGRCGEALESLMGAVEILQGHFDMLIDNTIVYFQQAEQNFTEADKAIARAIRNSAEGAAGPKKRQDSVTSPSSGGGSSW